MQKDKIFEIFYNTFILAYSLVCIFCFISINFEVDINLLELSLWILNFSLILFVRECVKQKFMTFMLYVIVIALFGVMFGLGRSTTQIGFLAIGFVALNILRPWFNKAPVRICAGLITTVFMIITFFRAGDLPRVLIAVNMVLLLNVIADASNWFKVSKAKNGSFIVVFFAAALIMCVLPTSPNPFEWKFAYKIGTFFENLTFDIIDSLGNGSSTNYFSIQQTTGYSGKADTKSGKITDSNRTQMYINGKKTEDSLYLIGNVTADFDGRIWTNKTEVDTLSLKMDAWMTAYACYYFDGRDMKKYAKPVKKEITYADLKTKSIFLPEKTLEYGAAKTSLKTTFIGDNTRFTTVKKRNTKYYVIYLEIDYKSKAFCDVINRADQIEYSEEIFNELVEYMRGAYECRTEITYEEFLESVTAASKNIRKRYVSSDTGISDRAASWKNARISSMDSDFYKCVKIANAVSGFNYNKDIEYDESDDVVDEFLFAKKTGYCVHFSTALALLLRDERIPTRVVEGFCSNYEYVNEKDEYIVEGTDAHAWVQAYIENIGWLKLDGVSGYQLYEDESSSNMESNPNDSVHTEEDDQTEEEAEEIEESFLSSNIFVMIIFMVAAVVIIGLLFAIILIVKWQKDKHTMNPDIIIRDILRKIEKTYGKREDSETVKEYFERIQSEFISDKEKDKEKKESEENKETDFRDEVIKKLRIYCEAYWYGGGSFSENDIIWLKRVRDHVF